jgi:hypothetical protein
VGEASSAVGVQAVVGELASARVGVADASRVAVDNAAVGGAVAAVPAGGAQAARATAAAIQRIMRDMRHLLSMVY